MDIEKIKALREKLRILDRETNRPFDNDEACCGLTPSQSHTLLEVGKRGEISLVDLAVSLGLDTSTLSRTIQGLVLIGLVDRSTNEKDRRYVVLNLTEQGRKVYEEIENLVNGYLAQVLVRVEESKRDAVFEGVTALSDAVKQYNEETGCCRKEMDS